MLETLDDYVLNWARSENRIWFWKPQWYWHGLQTLVPVLIGHDEYARRVLTLGWTITGRVNIALGDCGGEWCKENAYRNAFEWLKGAYRDA